MDTIENKDLNYWKKNAEEDYMQVPISVLRYISELEEVVKNNAVLPPVSSDERWVCQKCGELVDGRNVTFEEYHEGCGGRCRHYR